MYLIIIIQNASSFINKCQQILVLKDISAFDVLSSGHMAILAIKATLCFLEFYVVIFFVFLSILSFYFLHKMLNRLTDYKEESFQVRVTGIKNANYQYVLTYFSTYIFPFITINLSTVAGILQFAVLWSLIGYIYVKNDLVYINPTLNIFFRYNIYEADMELKDGNEIITFSSILLSKKEKNCIEKMQVIRESEGLHIET